MMLGMMGGQSTGATTDKELLSPDTAIVFWRLAHTFFVAAELALALFGRRCAARRVTSRHGPYLSAPS